MDGKNIYNQLKKDNMNNLSETELLRKAEQHTRCAEYKSAIHTYEYILDNYENHTIYSGYNLANIYQAHLGEGKIAKDYYQKVIKWNNSHPDYLKQDAKDRKDLDSIIAATYENISLLSDSYNEIYDWAKKLWLINPEEKNLRQNIEIIKEKENKGKPWKETYFETAGIFYNVDPKKDRGLYGFAASIYKRLLLNRNLFRLDRLEYEFSAIGYGGLMQLIIDKTFKTQRQTAGNLNFDEIEFVIKDAVSILSEYLNSNPNDERVKKAVELLKKQKQKYTPQNDLPTDMKDYASQVIKYNPIDFAEGSPFYNPEDDNPPRCRSCGSNNIYFYLANNQRFWTCDDCGRLSGKNASYNSESAIPSPENDPYYQKGMDELTGKINYDFRFINRLLGETRCHNQIMVSVKNQNELFEIVGTLKEILLIPFENTPSVENFHSESQRELMMVNQLYASGKNVSLHLNHGYSQNTYCLVGNSAITIQAWIYNSLGMEQTAINNLSKAMEYFNLALNDSPDYSFAVYNMATCLAMTSNLKKALQYYEKAHEYYPYDRDIANELMECRQSVQGSMEFPSINTSGQGVGCLFTCLVLILLNVASLVLILL